MTRFLKLALTLGLLPAANTFAIGLSQPDEARPYETGLPPTADENWGRLAASIVFGSNYVSWYGDMDTKEDSGHVSVINWVNNGEFARMPLGDEWTFNAALVQRNSWVSVHGGDPFPSYVGLTSIWIDTGFLHHAKDSPWSQAIVLSPGVSSDMAHADARMFRLPVQASVQYAVSPRLAFELGVVYTPEFTLSTILPLPGVTWRPTDDWELRYRFTTFNLNRRLAPRTSLGVFASYDEASWMVGSIQNYGRLDFMAGTAGAEFVRGFDITDTLPATLHLALGGVFGGAVRRYDPDGSRLVDSLQLDEGLFVRVGLVIRF